ncbi:MAG: NDP-sugar synthase [Actinomycetota bacterium]
MKAVVLVGGEGTRLRPLTETIPKPLINIVDRPQLDHVLDLLARHGVDEVVLSSPYLEQTFHPFIAARGDLPPSVRWITEEAPLGTGGAIVNALEHLGDEPFLALNGDILTDLDLTAMRAFHRERGATATIGLTHVDDARPFGLVPIADDGRVIEFREKPLERVPGDVNAGTYLLDPSSLTAWPAGENVSIEREIFPALIADGRPLYGYLSEAYWLDLGTPEKYLQAHADILEGEVEGLSYPAPWIADTADVDLRSHLGRWVAVGAHASIAAEAAVDDSVLLPGAIVEARAHVTGTILGPGARVGEGAIVTDGVLAEGAEVPDDMEIEGARIPPGQIAAEDED